MSLSSLSTVKTFKKVLERAGQVMRKLHAKCVSASESGGEYSQVLFEREQDGDRAYFLAMRQS
jgi:type II secretory pathway component PulF